MAVVFLARDRKHDRLVPVAEDLFLTEDVEAYLHFGRGPDGDPDELMWEWSVLRGAGRLIETGCSEEALPLLERATELFPSSSMSHFALAWALSESGDSSLARELGRRALELDPHNDDARVLLEELERD